MEREADRRFALAELNDFLTEPPRARFAAAVSEADLERLPPLMQNYVAAMAEEALGVVTQYFDESQLLPKTRLALEELLGD